MLDRPLFTYIETAVHVAGDSDNSLKDLVMGTLRSLESTDTDIRMLICMGQKVEKMSFNIVPT